MTRANIIGKAGEALSLMVMPLLSDCEFYALPASGRRRGGDLRCDGCLYEVKTCTTDPPRFSFSRSNPFAIPVKVIWGFPPVVIFPFPGPETVVPTPRGDVIVQGVFCPVRAGLVQTYPQPVKVGNLLYTGGTGFIYKDRFIAVKCGGK